MTTELEALARRAVACPRWRWMPGMGWLRLPSGAPDDDGDCGRHDEYMIRPGADSLPDLSDPATVGCLLQIVREAWGDQRLVVVPMSDGKWGVALSTVTRDYRRRHRGRTEAAALVAALEAAP